MQVVCLDLEGVLVPEIWIEFANRTGIEALRRTTRDEPDYDKLMKYRLDILREHKLGLPDIQKVIAEMGGKNAIIVDDDADLDEAVLGVVQSAFGYAGQKCSACSRRG